MIIKNIDRESILNLSEQVTVQSGQIVSKTLVQNDSLSITLFAFDKGEEISTHQSKGDALVTVLEGTGQVTINDKIYSLKCGQTILMPANNPHSVYGCESFKMILIVVFKKGE